jgi:hypothetical protein
MRFTPGCLVPLAVLVAIGLLASLALSAPPEPTPKLRDNLSPRLFPMKVGAKWVYAFDEKEVTFEVLRSEKGKDDGGAAVFVVRRTIDKSVVDFRVAVEEDGVYIHAEGDKEFSPPLRQFAFFARAGDTWKWRGTYGGKKRSDVFENLGVQEVKVPAGTYSAVAVERRDPDGPDHTTFWLAPNVGVVRLSGKTELFGDGEKANLVVFEWRLKSYTPGDK